MHNLRLKEIESLIDYLLASGYLKTAVGKYPTINVTNLGVQVLKGQVHVMRKVTTAKQIKTEAKFDRVLFERLRNLRLELSTKNKVPPYIIFPDKTLEQFCLIKPKNEAEMLTVSGVGQAKLAKYGQDFLNEINNYDSQKD